LVLKFAKVLEDLEAEMYGRELSLTPAPSIFRSFPSGSAGAGHTLSICTFFPQPFTSRPTINIR
jgi:hypothetical protein